MVTSCLEVDQIAYRSALRRREHDRFSHVVAVLAIDFATTATKNSGRTFSKLHLRWVRKNETDVLVARNQIAGRRLNPSQCATSRRRTSGTSRGVKLTSIGRQSVAAVPAHASANRADLR